MPVLPYDRVVSVTVTRNNNFPARRGFGTPLFLTSQSVAGQLDASNLTKLYGSMDEVAVDFSAGDEFYDAALAAFSQNPAPLSIKASWYDGTSPTATTVADDLDDIQEADPNWYFLTVESDLRDDVPIVTAISDWAEARVKIPIIESNDADMKTPTNTTNVAAVLKATDRERTAIMYHEEIDEYPAIALAAVISTFVLDEDESAYTPAFKQLRGITRNNIGSAALQAVTGFIPKLGQNKTAGHLATTYVDIGGQNHTQFGSVMSQNTFIDEIHFGDWLKARTEEEMFAILLNNKRVPFDDRGMAILAAGPQIVMDRAVANGAIAQDIDEETGDLIPVYTMTVPRATSVPASQRNARISPPIRITYRYAGAVHYAQADYTQNY